MTPLEAAREVEKFKKKIQTGCEQLVKRLAQEGQEIASMKFGSAIYAGYNDVHVEVEEDGKAKVLVIALGNAVLFIEFGTGVRYPTPHPEAGKFGFTRGGYGQGRGANPKGWFYKGDPGNAGEPARQRPGMMHTYGNPANRCMYGTVRELEEHYRELVKECFK